jgi:hypothetical protein
VSRELLRQFGVKSAGRLHDTLESTSENMSFRRAGE